MGQFEVKWPRGLRPFLEKTSTLLALSRREKPARGFALIAVLWISSLLSLLAFGVLSNNKTELHLAENALEQAKARAMADAGVHLAVYDLLTEQEDQRWHDGALTAQIEFDEGDLRYSVSDEDAKIDINTASDELLAGLLLATETPRHETQRLVARLNAFRKTNGSNENTTTVDGSGQSPGAGFVDGNRPFTNIEELLTIIGMDEPTFNRVKPHVTIFADINGFDPSYASETTLQALPGMTPALATALAKQNGRHQPELNLAERGTDIPPHYLIPSRRTIFSIRAVGATAKSGRFVRYSVIALDGGTRSLPFTVFLWSKGQASPNGN